MDFYFRATGTPAKLAILPGAFNPPTRAHLAMAEAALSVADEVLFVLPRAFPHKQYSGAAFDTRVAWLQAALAGNPRFSLAAADRGLFIDIAREAGADYGQATELFILCGRDAAERIVNWDYGPGEDIRKQLEVFALLVASRGGPYQPPPEMRDRVRPIALPAEVEQISSTEVRRRIQAGEPWESLVPARIVPMIR
jgi:nicotinate (nicotinamide) nucleotide adenylyltransferase